MKNQRLEAQKMYSQSSFRFGDNVVKMCVVPTGALQEELAHITVTPEHPSTILCECNFPLPPRAYADGRRARVLLCD